MKLLCPDGRHEVKMRFNPAPGERFCPEHGCSLVPLPKGSGGQSKQGLPGEKAAKSRFRQVVCARPCFFLDRDEFGERRRPDHSCSYPLDVLVINVAGYVGSSTRREIAYARERGKLVRWLFPEAVPADLEVFESEVTA